MRKLEETLDVEGISLNVIDTIVAWRVETERLVMESAHDWLEEEAVEGVAATEEEDEEKWKDEVTPPTMVTSRGRGLPLIALSSSTSTSASPNAFFI